MTKTLLLAHTKMDMLKFKICIFENYYYANMKKTLDGTKGGLLVGPTDKDGGVGIPATIGGFRHVILGGGEIIINEEAANQNCEELSRINESTGGRHIDCGAQKTANTGKFDQGGYVGDDYEIIIFTKATGKPLQTFKSLSEAADWIDLNLDESDYPKYSVESVKTILSTEEVESALGRSIRFFNDYIVTIKGLVYEKMGLRTTYELKYV